MRALWALLLAVPASGSMITSINCTVTTPGGTTSYSDPLACPGGEVEFNENTPYNITAGLGPGFPNWGTPGYGAVVTLSLDFADLFRINNVQSGTIQWFGLYDRFVPGDPVVNKSASIGGNTFWQLGILAPLTTSFTSGQAIALSIHFDAWGQCCLGSGPDNGSWTFSLSQVKVFDADGNLVAAPQYSSSSGYLYPVLGGVQASEPGTWLLAALGLGLVTLRLRRTAR